MSDSDLFVHLRARSAYSLLESMLHVKALGALAKKHHMPAVGLTDTNNLFGALEFSEALAEKGVQPIVGCALTVREESGSQGVLALLAQSEAGYANLMRLSSEAFLKTPPNEAPRLFLPRVLELSEGLIALTGGQGGLLAAMIEAQRDPRVALDALASAFPARLYVELQRHDEPGEAAVEEALVGLAYELGLPLAATNDVRFEKRPDHGAHDALMCIAASSYLGEEERPRVSPEHYFKTGAEMRALFHDLPEAIEQSVDIARRCAYRVPTRRPIMPRFTTEAGRDEPAELAAQAEEGLRRRLDFIGADKLAAPEEKYWERLKYELGVINQMGFPGYFLIVSDFIKWAKAQDIPVGPGRGSGAGSLVAWSLTITDLDPLRFGLFFERFLNPERISMPDFDIDFCQDRRGEVIDYVKERYGADRVAQIITFGTLQARAVLRDTGRVMQLPYGQVDRLAKMVPANPANPVTLPQAVEIEPRIKEMAAAEPEVGALLDVAQQLEGLHRNASTHAAGVVIGDRPLVELVPLYRDPRSDIPATQFNMKWVEPAGLVKFDFLGLKTLTVLKTCVDLIRLRGIELDLARIPLDDVATFDLLQRAETIGVFQLESTGMKDVLRKMKPDKFEDIIALVALYRPGPMDDIPKYINCKSGIEEVDYPHEMLAPILEETYGVIVYQEQAMQIAQVLSGYSLGEADILRRAMGKKIPAEMAKQKSRFIDGAVQRGVDKHTADHIFELVAKFAGYGFNKGHSAPYGLLAYQTAYLKANYPVEFFAASMTLDCDNTDKLATFRQDARRLGVEVLPPDVNASEASFSVEDGAIRYALAAVRNVGANAMAQVAMERRRAGPFKDLFDFAERIDPKAINKRALENLARAGAFDRLEPDRRRAFAACDMIAGVAAKAAEERASAQASLFGGAEPIAQRILPKVSPWSPQERLDHERESVGFYLSGHPLDAFLAHAPPDRYQTYADVVETGETSNIWACNMTGVVRRVQYRPAQSGGMLAYVSLSDPTAEYEVMVMPEHVAAARERLEVGKPVLFKARVRWRDGDLKLAGDSFESVEMVEARALGDLKVIVGETASPTALAETFASLRAAARTGDVRPLRLILKLADGREIEIAAKGQYPAGPTARAALKAARGVERVA